MEPEEETVIRTAEVGSEEEDKEQQGQEKGLHRVHNKTRPDMMKS